MADETNPETSPETNPRGDAAADSSRASSASSATSSADPFQGHRGPGFDPESAPEPGAPGAGPEPPPIPLPELEVETVRDLLLTAGDGAHAIFGVGEFDWAMTQRDLERIAPPLTRIVNRYPGVARLASHSDEAAVAIGSGLYAWRSMLERRAVLEARRSGTPSRPGGGAPPVNQNAEAAAVAEFPEGYVPAAEQLRATRPDQPPPQETP
jgi:hypothetical protein